MVAGVHSKKNRCKRYGFGTGSVMNEINITPFVDVVLVLLIVFMITSPMLIAGVHVDLPKSSSSPITPPRKPISVTITSKNELYVQDTKVAPRNLIKLLNKLTDNNKNSRILIRGDRRIDYGNVMAVIGAINKAGYKKVALITEVSS